MASTAFTCSNRRRKNSLLVTKYALHLDLNVHPHERLSQNGVVVAKDQTGAKDPGGGQCEATHDATLTTLLRSARAEISWSVPLQTIMGRVAPLNTRRDNNFARLFSHAGFFLPPPGPPAKSGCLHRAPRHWKPDACEHPRSRHW